MEKEIEDTEFRLKLGYDLGRFNQFWDDDTLFKCRYSRSKWLFLSLSQSSTPPGIYLRALKRNKNIIHITFYGFHSDFDVNGFLTELPWVTSISSGRLPAIHHERLFIKSTNNDLITFAKKNRHKLDLSSTYIFIDAGGHDMYSLPDRLGNNARVLISFLAPTSDQSLALRLKHSGKDNGPLLEVTLGSTKIQLNPPCESSLTIDDITLGPICGPSESDNLSFEPGIRNDIVIQFRGTGYGHFLHDIELLDEAKGGSINPIRSQRTAGAVTRDDLDCQDVKAKLGIPLPTRSKTL